MSKRDNIIWKIITAVCWLIFVGFCLQTGTLLFNLFFSLFRDVAAHNLHLGLDLSDIYVKNKLLYIILVTLIIAVSALKAFIFYIVISLFKKLNLNKPFSEEIASSILKLSYYSLGIGMLSIVSQHLTQLLEKAHYKIETVEEYWNDAGAFLMMSAILFVIGLIFRKGIELQNETDLTI
jgi:ABC-type multidrug transport system fused ATPase/permease subunit